MQNQCHERSSHVVWTIKCKQSQKTVNVFSIHIMSSSSSRLSASSFLIFRSEGKTADVKITLTSLNVAFSTTNKHTEVHLNLLDDVHAVLAVNHIHCKAPFAKAPWAADPVEVRLIVGVPIEVHREVKVHHECHLFHIDSCKQSTASFQFSTEMERVLLLYTVIDSKCTQIQVKRKFMLYVETIT